MCALLLPVGRTLHDVLSGRAALEPQVRLIGVASVPSEQSYPINRLRNVAIRAVRTSHFLMLDVDMWPSASLATIIANLAPVALLRRKLAALVVPAFQLEEHAVGDLVLTLAPTQTLTLLTIAITLTLTPTLTLTRSATSQPSPPRRSMRPPSRARRARWRSCAPASALRSALASTRTPRRRHTPPRRTTPGGAPLPGEWRGFNPNPSPNPKP